MIRVEEHKENRYKRQILAFKNIIEQFEMPPLQRILVLGCGVGLEAGYMNRLLGVNVFGLDINQQFHPFGWMNANLRNYDGKRLPFSNGYFDAIYSYHVLEHMENVPGMMAEIRRVLRPNGFFYVGVPNKSRLFGYLGMADKSVYHQMRQNIKDWNKRLRGEWENALGAHAGFREDELSCLLHEFFSRVVPVTRLYYAAKWDKYKSILTFLSRCSMDKVMLPSIYMLALA